MKKLLTLIALLSLISSKAQTWEKIYSTTYTIGGLGCQENEFNSTSGGLYLGMANMTPPWARIIRFNTLGDTLWTKPVTLDSIGYNYYVTSTSQKLNGNYLLAGFATHTTTISKSYFIVELTSGGIM
ncbi:MAG: hypothetical protein IPJ32_05220 [Sphingobacteriaceae bacterium]|nr:hypothetical protein [Sphingobacteriaceae bacterium]